jgi:hypothetical protein
MKQAWLQLELALSSLYILLMIVFAIFSNEGRFLGAIMLFFLGIWQYGNALIWIIAGDRIRVRYFVSATIFLVFLVFFSNIDIDINADSRSEVLAFLFFLLCTLSLAIWYQLNTYRHIQTLNKEEDQLGEGEENTELS